MSAARRDSAPDRPIAAPEPASRIPGTNQTQPLTVRVPEACRLSGIGRSKLYELIKAHEIAIIKEGTITLIPVQSLKAYLGIG